MKIHSLLTIGAAAIMACGAPVLAADEAPAKQELWTQDYEAAKTLAAKDGKDILIDFTGSDWCIWCIRLKKEVLATPEFEAAAPKKFVLIEADFPRDQSKLSETIKTQNEKLMKEFGVRGFPTLMLLDAKGRPYASTGYQEGGPAPYLETLDKLAATRRTRDAAWDKAAQAKDVEKAKLLAEGLAALDDEIAAKYYGSVIDEIRTLDPKDSTGVGGKLEYKKALEKLGASVQAERDAAAADKLVDDFIAANKATGERQQQAMMLKLQHISPATVEGTEKAEKLIDAVIAIDAKSKTGEDAARIKQRIGKMRAAIQERAAKKAADAPKAP